MRGEKVLLVPCYLPSIRLKYIVGEVLILTQKGVLQKVTKIPFEQWVRVYNLDCSRPVVILDFFLDKKNVSGWSDKFQSPVTLLRSTEIFGTKYTNGFLAV